MSLLQNCLIANHFRHSRAQAGIQNYLICRETGFPITTSGMTEWDFCKRLIRARITALIRGYLDLSQHSDSSAIAGQSNPHFPYRWILPVAFRLIIR
jgi:hypothetical protein